MYPFNQDRLLYTIVWASVACPFYVFATDITLDHTFVTSQGHSAPQLSIKYPQTIKQPVIRILYIPPKPVHTGRPKTRIAQGGTRGSSTELSIITLLTPDQYPVLTARSQPVLYWHLSRVSPHPVTVTLTTDEIEPLLEHVMVDGSHAGIHRLKLAEQGVRLQLGKIYEWSVSVQQNKDEFSASDLIARSFIQLSESSEYITGGANTQVNLLNKVAALAHGGFWYDALEELMETSQKVETEALLKQVGLSFSAVDFK